MTSRTTWLNNLRSNYSVDTARRDLVAGATVAAIAIPEVMAYALIAGVDPRFGLYSAIVVTLIASIFGSSSHLINGPTNAISLVIFSALAGFDERFDAYQAMFLLGIMIGVTQILIAIFKLGDLTRYISESVVLGFMAGAGLLVAIGQVGNFLGVAKGGASHHAVVVHLWETVTQSGPYNFFSVGVGLGTLLLTLLLRRVIEKYKLPRIDMLVALIIAAIVAAYFGWSAPKADGKTIISVVGTVPAALPSFHIPEINFQWVSRLAGSALAISFLGLLEALAVAKSIATHTRQPLDYNRQCVAEGLGNLIGGSFQSLPGSGSLTRSAINYQAGAITRMSGIYTSIIIGVVVLVLGPYARFIPKSALAGLLFIAAARLIDISAMNGALDGVRFLFHLAADYRLWAPNSSEVIRTNRKGTLTVMQAALDHGVERIVYTSSVATLRAANGSVSADETAPLADGEGIGAYKKSKVLAERLVERMVAEQTLPAVIVNPSTTIGQRDLRPTPTGRMVIEAACGRIPVFVDTGLNLVHVDDVAAGHLAAMEKGRIGERYILGGQNASLRELLAVIARLAGRKPPTVSIPRAPIYPLAYAAEALGRIAGKEPFLTVDALEMASHYMFFTSAKAELELGYTARPYADALRDALKWFDRAGMLKWRSL